MTRKSGKRRSPRVAILDFDGTIQSEEFPALAEPFQGAIEVIRQLTRRGWQVYVVTGRTTTDEVKEYLHTHDIPFKMVVTRPPFDVFVVQEYYDWKKKSFRYVQFLEQARPEHVLVVDDRKSILKIADDLGFVGVRIGGDVDWVEVNQTAMGME